MKIFSRIGTKGTIILLILSFSVASFAGSDYSFLDMLYFNRSLRFIKTKYLDPSRIVPEKMFVRILERLEKKIPEVVFRYNRNENTIKVQVGEKNSTIKLDPIITLADLSYNLHKIFLFLDRNLPEDIKREDIEVSAINAMLSTLDPHSNFLARREFKDFKIQTKGKFGGLGIIISIRNGLLTVISPIKGTPAYRAGIRARDRIMEIDGESTINMDLDEAVSKLRGKPGTEVTIGIKREGVPNLIKVTIKREIIKIQSVKSRLLEGGIAYISIESFQKNVAKDVRRHIERLKRKNGGKLSGIILDLRDNPGGLLDEAVALSDLFLKKGIIVSTQVKKGIIMEREVADDDGYEPDMPLVVLVNEGSASASEIVTAALKYHKRGLVLGQRTFGKGTVQVIYGITRETGLKLTIAEYLTPGDRSIHDYGVVPDVKIVPVSLEKDWVPPKSVYAEEDPTPQDMVYMQGGYLEDSFRESDLSARELDLSKLEKPSFYLKHLLTRDELKVVYYPDYTEELKEDYVVKIAESIIHAGLKASSPQDRLREFFDRLNQKEEERISRYLKRQYHIEWGDRTEVLPEADDLDVTVSLKDLNGRKKPVAGDRVRMIVRVKNKSKKTFQRLHAITLSPQMVFKKREFIFGRLKPGESISWSTTFRLPASLPTQTVPVEFKFFVDNRESNFLLERRFPITGRKRPELGYTFGISDRCRGCNRDGAVQKGEEVMLRIRVFNMGDGPTSDKTYVILVNKNGRDVFLKKGRIPVGEITPGGSKKITMGFRVKKEFGKDSISFELKIDDVKNDVFLGDEIEIPLLKDTMRKKGGRLKASTPLCSIPRKGCEWVAVANSPLYIAGELDGFYAVRVNGDIFWSEKELAGSVKEIHRGVKTGAITYIPYTAPHIELEYGGDYIVKDQDLVRVRVILKHPQKVKDLYVYNRYKKGYMRNLKVSYIPVGKKSYETLLNIPLKPGKNEIIVYSRSGTKRVSYKKLFIYKK